VIKLAPLPDPDGRRAVVRIVRTLM
jgi:hypothetical protein